MKDKKKKDDGSFPLVFGTHDVLCIMDGRKTRAVKTEIMKGWRDFMGKTVWIKETFKLYKEEGRPGGFVTYRAGASKRPIVDLSLLNKLKIADVKWKSAIFMPRLISRISLSVIGIKRINLRSITEDDAILEGIDAPKDDGQFSFFNSQKPKTRLDAYVELWNKNHASARWEDDPPVLVYDFKLLEIKI